MRRKVLFSVAAVLAVVLGARLLHPWYTRQVWKIPRETPAGLAKIAGWEGTAPNAPDAFRFVVVGDRTGNMDPGAWPRAVTEINRLRPDLVLCVGDLVDGFTADAGKSEAQWHEFEQITAGLAAPFFYCSGNHDVGIDSDWKVYVRRHGVAGEAYYSFSYRQCRFVVLDSTELLHGEDEKQWTWLTGVLAAAGEARHVFVFAHHPLYDHRVWARLRKMLDPTKTTIFSGHRHRLSYAVEDGVPYFVLGPTGARAHKPDRGRGLFQSFAHVTVSDGEPTVAIIPMGEVLAHDVVGRRKPTATTSAATSPAGE